MKLINLVLLFGFLCIGVFANDAKSNDQSPVSDNNEDGFWEDEYDVNWYSDEVEKLGIVSQKETDLGIKDINPNVNIKEILIKTPEDQPISAESDNNDDKKDTTFVSDKGEGKQDYDSYQIEDNRSAMTGDDLNKNIEQAIPISNENDKLADKNNIQDLVDDVNIELNENDLKRIANLKDREVFRDVTKEVNSVEVKVADTKPVDIETDSMHNDAASDEKVDDINDFSDLIADPIGEPSQSIQNETKKILEEDNSNLNNEPEISETPTVHPVEDISNDTAEAIFNDIGDELKELFTFWDDLDDVDDDASDEISESVEDEDEDEGDDTYKTFVEQQDLEQKAEKSTEKPIEQSTTIDDQDKNEHVADPELSSSEVNDLMTRFAILHFDDIDIKSDDFDKNIAPIHMILAVDQVIEVTSPNYPDDYPNNNIVDWIFSGAGKGIELNITDFSVNGFAGDFMLVVPGGIDNAVDNGIVFSYTLNKEKHYEFLDVDQLFVRFASKSGLPSKGFKFSVRLLEHLPEATTSTEEPEVPIAEPSAQLDKTLMVYLAGVNPEQFLDKAEEFRLIVADMALEFIARNGLEIGVNNTSEVSQIVSTSSCNVHWSDFGTCTAVRVGVPLNGAPGLEEQQLRAMWESLVIREPFSARMRGLGITEFALPSDGSAMTVWLVISVGVVLSAAMLAFALWRWNCTEDYTRMTSFGESDTESVFKKSPLDLFPASRQTMPPMYDDHYFDASTKVDMGGFSNKSYVRHGDFLPVDSDDETHPGDNRYPTAKGGL